MARRKVGYDKPKRCIHGMKLAAGPCRPCISEGHGDRIVWIRLHGSQGNELRCQRCGELAPSGLHKCLGRADA